MICRLLLWQMLVLLSTAYLVDQSNYFYINSSFHNMCFHFIQPTTIQIQSPLLVPMKDHITTGQLSDQISAKFAPPYDSEVVGYNNYDSGQYWVGVKLRQQNELRKGSFEKIKISVKSGEKVYTYVFLAPLFRMPLNAFEIYPTNTLYRFQDFIFISYLHKYNEVDAYIFQKSNNGSKFKLLQKSDWGFSNEDSNTVYQRHKSKKSNKLTVEITTGQTKSIIQIVPTWGRDEVVLEDNKFAFEMEDLMQKSTKLAIAQSEL